MCKHIVVALLLLIYTSTFHQICAQTLFTYGSESVSVKQFLEAFNKNNTSGKKDPKSVKEYLDLYIASRLKIAEAKKRGYDTLPQLLSDLENLRAQIIPTYLTDEESVNKLLNEAFIRSQKDIHLAHIFISFTQNGLPDTNRAKQKSIEAFNQLKKGVPFSDVARKYSDDPSVKDNDGDIGYITVFSLPYELENLAYSTAAGKISDIHRSKAGYHIFKNLGERKAIGKIKAAQILLAYPPDANEQTKQLVKKLADSLYNRVQQGDDFGKLAAQFSNDVVSAASNGVMPEFAVGQYDPVFENTVFSLKEGEVSKPFVTAHGYHIVKLISRVPVVADKNDKKAMQNLREKVEQSDRMKTTKEALAHRVLKLAGLKKLLTNTTELAAYTDSTLDNKKITVPIHITSSTPVFSIGNKKFTVADWVAYAQAFRYKSDGSGLKPYPQVLDEFVQAKALEYYEQHLEDFNSAFRNQITEFRDGNLFFEIMQREIWTPAQSDSMSLKTYFEKHKQRYTWKKSADAIIFYSSDLTTANEIIRQLKTSPVEWRNTVAGYSEKVAADSGRFELGQIPNASKTVLKPGAITPPLINSADNTVSFAYIITLHPQPEPRTFEQAKGVVINDFQEELDKAWVAELRKKYPVKINQQA
ncbi:MAG: peptidylprolyl isomerase, partial [Chitinophagaceae bacterium]|nr:peptidylprolyl isomerase [Chitinophagaceae bacterium]